MFLNKRWLIKCTCPLFHSIYKTKVCVRNHPHTVIQGKDASIAHAWKEQVFPVRWISKLLLVDGSNEDGVRFDTETMDLQPLFGEPVPDVEDTLHGHPSSSSSKWSPVGHGRWEKTAGNSSAELHDGKNYEPTPKEVAQWDVQLLKFHKASGHPSNRNLARIIKEAGKQEWQVQRAHQLRCSACEAVKLGGSSSGKVPPAAMSSPPKAWSTVLVDIGEWTMMARKQKLKFMMVIDGATKFKATHLIMTYSLIEQGNENAQQVIEGFSHCWLADKPRPMIVIPGNASTLRSTAFREFCDNNNNNNIWLSFPVEKEPWAHGIAERGIQELKLVMDKIYIEDATLSAATILSLAIQAPSTLWRTSMVFLLFSGPTASLFTGRMKMSSLMLNYVTLMSWPTFGHAEASRRFGTQNYIDLTNEVPEETALEITEDLPAEPNNKTGVSGRRLSGKHSEAAAKALPPLPPVNEYEENKGPPPVPDDLEETGNTETPAMSRRGSTSTTKPLLADSSASSLAQPASPRQIPAVSRETSVGGDAPEPKRAKTDSEMETVRYEKLTPAFKKLFDRAKNRAFVTAEAVRKCTEAEEREGWESGRVIGCRWVLTWKDVPPEDRQHAADDATNNDQTPFTPSGDRKSKARIVHLGYQHPDLLKPEFRSSAQIQATISRYLTFALTVQNQWRIEGLDLSTAFLQTEKNQESQRLWTQLARELRQALGVSDGGLLRILKDSYGSTTAPRGLWRDIDRNLQKLGIWMLKYSPDFTVSAKKSKSKGLDAVSQIQSITGKRAEKNFEPMQQN
ncbi:unnamed protein product [Cladocopium goreaui]|uniref:Integrase catalytic domain-containing protein n=1 Tax=Cladocopium goreaui TaxID=2562237 RepID=A0A9P1CB19_9DINO|nr:unnamed protein product [Cladocopium goreaui]